MTDPTILEFEVRLDATLRDLDEDCTSIASWIANHRLADALELTDELHTLRRSIRSEYCLLAMFVSRLETESTRSRVVPPEMAS